MRTRKDKFREVPVGRQTWWLMEKDRDFSVWSWLYLQHSYSVVWKKERTLTNDLLPSKVYCGSSRERERACRREKRDPLFLILLSTLMSSTLEVQEHSFLTVKDISRSRAFSLSPSFLHFRILFCFQCFCRLSVSLRWEKKRNNFKLLFEYTYIHWPCSVLFFPSIIIIIINMHPVYLSRRRQTEKRKVRNGI